MIVPRMAYHTNPDLEAVSAPPISVVAQWREKYAGSAPLLDLCQAVPDYPPAPPLIDYLTKVIQQPETARYTPDEGLEQVRESVVAAYAHKYQASLSPQHLCLTCGASAAFWLAITSLCRAGDEVILQNPCYFDHPMALQALNIHIRYAENQPGQPGVPSPASIQQLITPRTRAILLVTPSNPTGVTISRELLKSYFEIAQSHTIALILDETYSDFLYGAPHDLFQQENWDQTLIHIMSFGKTLALTGFRAGALIAAPHTIQLGLKVQDTMTVCQPRITQLAVQYGLDTLGDWIAQQREGIQRRHDRFCEIFTHPQNKFTITASGNFFAWVRHPYQQYDSYQACQHLAEQFGVLSLPGAAFGPGNEQYIRLALGNSAIEQLPEVADRFIRASQTLIH